MTKHINDSDPQSTNFTADAQSPAEFSVKKFFQKNISDTNAKQRTEKSSNTRPADITTALILWLIALISNFIGLLSTILDGSLQGQLHQSMQIQIPSELTPTEVNNLYTVSGYIALIFLTMITGFLIWRFSQGTKICFILLTAGGFFTILQAVGVFFTQESAWKAISTIIAGIATFGAILCGRTDDSMKYFGLKQGPHGKN